MIGPDSFEKIRNNEKEITKINGVEIKNIDRKGIDDLLPEPKIIFNLKHYLTGFDIDIKGNTTSSYIIEGRVKQSRGKEQIKINVNGNQYDVEVEEVEQDNNSYKNSEGKSADQEYTSLKMQRPEKMFDSIIRGNAVEAPINGTVLDIFVSESDKVKQGEILITLEAMKMENEIISPKDGKIEKIAVKKGSKVDTGDILIEIS